MGEDVFDNSFGLLVSGCPERYLSVNKSKYLHLLSLTRKINNILVSKIPQFRDQLFDSWLFLAFYTHDSLNQLSRL